MKRRVEVWIVRSECVTDEVRVARVCLSRLWGTEIYETSRVQNWKVLTLGFVHNFGIELSFDRGEIRELLSGLLIPSARN